MVVLPAEVDAGMAGDAALIETGREAAALLLGQDALFALQELLETRVGVIGVAPNAAIARAEENEALMAHSLGDVGVSASAEAPRVA